MNMMNMNSTMTHQSSQHNMSVCAMLMNCTGMNMNHGNGTTMNGMNMGHMGHMDMGGMMPMFFQTGKDLTILFEGWKTNTVGELIGSMIALFLMAFLYEGIKIFREELKKREFKSLGMGVSYSMKEKEGNVASNGAGNGNCRDHSFAMTTSRILSTLHILQTFLHMVQVFVGYLLMLAVMTYNVWIFLAVIVGAGCGYFAFGWRRVSIVDVGDHCL